MASPDPGLARYADLLNRLPELHDGLRRAGNVAEMLSRGTELACAETMFTRGIVVGVREELLSTDAMGVIGDPASDELRRRVLQDPPRLEPGTIEAELIRRPERYPTTAQSMPSVLAAALDLADPAFGVIAPESSVVGLLVLDRPAGEIDDADRSIVTLFGRMLSVVLEHVVLRARISELSAELRYLTVSAQALATEAFEGSITLPVHGRHLPSFRSVQPSAGPSSEAAELLSEREVAIATLLAEGRSNREIGEALFLSPDTVKDHVGRIVRKLGAANRVEAAVRFLGLGTNPQGGG